VLGVLVIVGSCSKAPPAKRSPTAVVAVLTPIFIEKIPGQCQCVGKDHRAEEHQLIA
jgi:hypothetical protein